MSYKICLVTTAHSPFDARIFHREAMTLSQVGYTVYIIAPHTKKELIDKIRILPLSLKKGRFYRMSMKNYQALLNGISIDARIYHLHDPELIPIGIVFKILRKRVIYDVHENVSYQVFSKEYIPHFFRKMISFMMKFIGCLSLFLFDKIVIAGEDIGLQSHFKKFTQKIVLLRNYPAISLSKNEVFPKSFDKISFIYTGGLSEDRGILEIIEAFKEIGKENVELILMGVFDSNAFKNELLLRINGYKNINYFPSVSYKEMFTVLSKCHVGLICFKPLPNNIGALSGRNNKIYEYMQTGLAVIGSDFPSWRNFIEGNKIGIVVNPTNILQIRNAMKFLISNREKMEEMQHNSKELSDKYSWELESIKLVNLYNDLSSRH